MGKQQPLYRVKWGGRNQKFIKKPKKHLYLFQYQRDTKTHIYTWIFYVNGLILLHSNARKINFILVKSLTSKGTTPLVKALEEIKQNITQEVSR